MKIPTLLALPLLLIAISLAVFIYYKDQGAALVGDNTPPPFGIEAVNITDKEAGVIWQSRNPAVGLVSYGDSNTLGQGQNDDRDNPTPQPHITHFVTIKGLTPDTTYYFKVRNGARFYPDNALTFKTGKTITPADNQPIFGVILNSQSSPVDEAIIKLKVDGASTLATLTTTAGNFILPLVGLRTTNLSAPFPITDKIPATLEVSRGDTRSTVKISLPSSESALPKIILGKDSDFSSIVASSAARKTNPLDLNSDGKVNSLDLSILLSNIGRKPSDPLYNKNADLNHDGKVDQKDIDLLKQSLQ